MSNIEYFQTPSKNYFMLGFFRYLIDPIRNITIPIGVVGCSVSDNFYKIRFPKSAKELPKEISKDKSVMGLINAEKDSLQEMFEDPNCRPLWIYGKPLPLPCEERFWRFHSKTLCHNISLENLTTCEAYGNNLKAMEYSIESEFNTKVSSFHV